MLNFNRKTKTHVFFKPMEPTEGTEMPTPWAPSILQHATVQRAWASQPRRIIHTLLSLASSPSLRPLVSSCYDGGSSALLTQQRTEVTGDNVLETLSKCGLPPSLLLLDNKLIQESRSGFAVSERSAQGDSWCGRAIMRPMDAGNKSLQKWSDNETPHIFPKKWIIFF